MANLKWKKCSPCKKYDYIWDVATSLRRELSTRPQTVRKWIVLCEIRRNDCLRILLLKDSRLIYSRTIFCIKRKSKTSHWHVIRVKIWFFPLKAYFPFFHPIPILGRHTCGVQKKTTKTIIVTAWSMQLVSVHQPLSHDSKLFFALLQNICIFNKYFSCYFTFSNIICFIWMKCDFFPSGHGICQATERKSTTAKKGSEFMSLWM